MYFHQTGFNVSLKDFIHYASRLQKEEALSFRIAKASEVSQLEKVKMLLSKFLCSLEI